MQDLPLYLDHWKKPSPAKPNQTVPITRKKGALQAQNAQMLTWALDNRPFEGGDLKKCPQMMPVHTHSLV